VTLDRRDLSLAIDDCDSTKCKGQNPIKLTCFDFKPHFCTKDTPFASKIDGHLPQSRGLFWNVFCKTGRSHNRKPFEYARAGFAAHFNISLDVSRSYFRFGMPYQYIRTAHVGGGCATRSVKPVDQRRAARRP
jgi:hypothetical protein